MAGSFEECKILKTEGAAYVLNCLDVSAPLGKAERSESKRLTQHPRIPKGTTKKIISIEFYVAQVPLGTCHQVFSSQSRLDLLPT